MALDLKKLCEEGQKKHLKNLLIPPNELTSEMAYFIQWDLDTHPVVHGRRLKNPELVKTQGLSPEKQNFTEEIRKALTHFQLEQYLEPTCQSVKCEYVKQAQQYEPRQERIYVSSHSGCYWASTNPEVISFLLRDLGVARNDILAYLHDTYGDPYEIELDCRSPIQLIDSFIELTTIPSTKIKTVRKCAIDDKAFR